MMHVLEEYCEGVGLSDLKEKNAEYVLGNKKEENER